MINDLLENGFIHLTKHLSNNEIHKCLDIYNYAWSEIKSNWYDDEPIINYDEIKI